MGVEDLCAAVDQFIGWSRDSGRLRRKRELRIRDQILRGLMRRLLQPYRGDGDTVPTILMPWVEAILAGKVNPIDAVEALLAAGTTAQAGGPQKATD